MPPLTFTVNGRPWEGDVQDGTSLLDLLRDRVGLAGAKLGCGEGQCGSCTVLVDGRAVTACITTAASVAQKTIVTVEGLSENGRLHPVQQAFIDAQAFQCGFCTPGMITAAVALLATNASPTDDEIKQALNGHICRCGTYPRIVDALRAAGATMPRETRRG
jgi:aerobic-type carbon monoxide dehydrogenase small subunit (CoxS/CutS family)